MASDYLPLHEKSPGKLQKLGFWRKFSIAVLIFIALNVSARLLIEFAIVGGWVNIQCVLNDRDVFELTTFSSC